MKTATRKASVPALSELKPHQSAGTKVEHHASWRTVFSPEWIAAMIADGGSEQDSIALAYEGDLTLRYEVPTETDDDGTFLLRFTEQWQRIGGLEPRRDVFSVNWCPEKLEAFFRAVRDVEAEYSARRPR